MRARLETDPDAGGAAFDAIEVDFEALAELVGTIRGLAGELAGNGDLCRHMNDPDLADVFVTAERNLQKQVSTLQTFMDTAADSLVAAATAYRLLEANLAQASQAVR